MTRNIHKDEHKVVCRGCATRGPSYDVGAAQRSRRTEPKRYLATGSSNAAAARRLDVSRMPCDMHPRPTTRREHSHTTHHPSACISTSLHAPHAPHPRTHPAASTERTGDSQTREQQRTSARRAMQRREYCRATRQHAAAARHAHSAPTPFFAIRVVVFSPPTRALHSRPGLPGSYEPPCPACTMPPHHAAGLAAAAVAFLAVLRLWRVLRLLTVLRVVLRLRVVL